MDAAGFTDQWFEAQGRLTEQQSKRFIELAVGNTALTRMCVVTCMRCGKRSVGRFHKLICWWRRFWA